jgi:dienelactone hydrolase
MQLLISCILCFSGQPWKEQTTTPGMNAKGQTYEVWRATHPEIRVSVDIRAAAACLRERYGVSSVVLWGTCYGGGKALEAAAGYRPDDRVHDVNGLLGPPLVAPRVVIAWYPTRYDASALFGKHRTVGKTDRAVNDAAAQQNNFAVMGVFAGNDVLPGATPDNASKLKALLEEDERVKDSLVKVFPGQDHGFGHIGLASKSIMDEDTAFGRFVDDEFGGAGKVSLDDGEADVACLLSTAFMEAYSRVFLPTTGPSIRDDQDEWSVNLEMKDLNVAKRRDIREEIETAANNFVPEPLGGRRIDPMDGDDDEALAAYLREVAKVNGIDFSEDDDVETLYEKNMAYEGFELF